MNHPNGPSSLLYLTDEQLRSGIEAMFFAYRSFTSDPDRILVQYGYGRAHHRALHFIQTAPQTTVNNLLTVLGVTKQSLNRVLRSLIDDGLVQSEIGPDDRRERLLSLTAKGIELERALAVAQQARVRDAFREAGPEAVQGFRAVCEAMMEPDILEMYQKLQSKSER